MTTKPEHADRYFNRELSWLEFNQRVLVEAFEESNPLLERLKFLAISGANLDEFFRVRFGGLQMLSQSSSGRTSGYSDMPAQEQVLAISARVRDMVAAQQKVFGELLEPALVEEGICRRSGKDLSDQQRRYLNTSFADEATALLAPIGVLDDDPFPHLANLALHLCVRIKVAKGGAGTLLATSVEGEQEADEINNRERFAIIPIGEQLPRIVRLPAEGNYQYILVEDAIETFVDQFFPGQEVIETIPFRITRNADLSVREDSAADLMQGMTEILDARKESPFIRLELSGSASTEMRRFLTDRCQLESHQCFSCAGPVDFSSYFRLADAQGFQHLKYPHWPPQPSPDIDSTQTVFETVRRRDLMLLHPYHSFEPVVRFLTEAAADPDVLSIKQTLYRTSRNSPIIEALCKAAASGKNVTVLVELKARFDEARNIEGAKQLEQSGAHVIYGVKGLKTHAKLCVIVRRGPDGLERYGHFGTGNYNESTARIYSDVSLLTMDEDLGQDAISFFNAISGYSQPQAMSKLDAAPFDLRNKLLELIDIEIDQTKLNRPARIRAKLNSLVDRRLIDALYEASNAGVKIDLNIRGICCLRPGIAGLSENIRVVSIVDRFLEHARIFHFEHGGDPRYYIASADWMERNLDRRLELLVPVEAVALQKRLDEFLAAYFRDNVKASELQSDGSYLPYRSDKLSSKFRSQEALYQAACESMRRLEREKLTEFQPHASHRSD